MNPSRRGWSLACGRGFDHKPFFANDLFSAHPSSSRAPGPCGPPPWSARTRAVVSAQWFDHGVVDQEPPAWCGCLRCCLRMPPCLRRGACACAVVPCGRFLGGGRRVACAFPYPSPRKPRRTTLAYPLPRNSTVNIYVYILTVRFGSAVGDTFFGHVGPWLVQNRWWPVCMTFA